MIDTKENLEIKVGDVVRYVDVAKPDTILTAQITRGQDNFDQGIINRTRPLAQALLGAVVGDEVELHLPGRVSKTLKVLEIARKED